MKTADQIEQQEERKAAYSNPNDTKADKLSRKNSHASRKRAIAEIASFKPISNLERKHASRIVGRAEAVLGTLSRKDRNALKGKRADGKPLSQYAQGQHPNSHTASGKRYTKDQASHLKPFRSASHNPGGRLKHDVAREIARAIFENNTEALYLAYGKAALKGNAYAFTVLADRAYGKLKERHEYELSEYREVSEKALIERIRQLEQSLGLARISLPIGDFGHDETRAGDQVIKASN
jgi:hypothetical protein